MNKENTLSKLEKIARKIMVVSVVVVTLGMVHTTYNCAKIIQDSFQNKTNREVYEKNINDSLMYVLFPGTMTSIISAGYLVAKDIEKQKKKRLNYQI